nr:MAG TPA: ECF sigma factor [Caudoviricetes sp.]
MDEIDQQIVNLYIVRRLPQLDAAGEIGIDRKTISRRLPHIYNIARRLVGKTDKEKAP